EADMEDTLKQIKALAPESLTVHALALKRASRMGQEQKQSITGNGRDEKEMAKVLSNMIDMAAKCAEEMQLFPYYMYRQKNIAGNFENVGYAKEGKAGIYNILIMEEKQTIVAAGAGASTKLVLPNRPEYADKNKKRIERVENVKDVEQYISRIDEMIERKGELLWP
ncbi:MAG: coproporphyrinogen dehydrogenase HemZ, partial [Lachnospiraceae bacterium]